MKRISNLRSIVLITMFAGFAAVMAANGSAASIDGHGAAQASIQTPGTCDA